MSGFTFVLNELAQLDDMSKDKNRDEDGKSEKSNNYSCFVCSKTTIEFDQTASNVRRNDKNLVPVLFQILTDGKSTCDSHVDLLLKEQEDENSPVSFCSSCRIYLRLWHDLMTSIIPVLEKSNQIKLTIIANLLASSRSPQVEPLSSVESKDSAGFLRKLDGIRKKLRNEYSPAIVLERLEEPPSSAPNVEDGKLVVGDSSTSTIIGETDWFDLHVEPAADFCDSDDNQKADPAGKSDITIDQDPHFQLENNESSSAQTRTDAADLNHSTSEQFLPTKSATLTCDVCGSTLKTEQSLRRHKLQVHSGANFVCQYCGKVFKEKPYFDSHVAIHEKGDEAKKFQCEYCGKKFGMGREFRKHVRRVHTKETFFNCLHCELKFTNQDLVHKHRFSVHGVLPPKKKKKRNLNGDC